MNVTYIGNHSDEKPIYLVTDTIYAMSGATLDAALVEAGFAAPFGSIVCTAGLADMKMKGLDGTWVEVE